MSSVIYWWDILMKYLILLTFSRHPIIQYINIWYEVKNTKTMGLCQYLIFYIFIYSTKRRIISSWTKILLEIYTRNIFLEKKLFSASFFFISNRQCTSYIKIHFELISINCLQFPLGISTWHINEFQIRTVK